MVSGDATREYLEFEHLWERSTGGTAVAVSPHHDAVGPWPVGPSSLGADEAVEALAGVVSAPVSADQILLFLVGGPGNGKSALARRAVSGLSPVEVADTRFAHRIYAYHTAGGRDLVVINDATIPPSNDGPVGLGEDDSLGSLQDDVSNALKTGSHVLANVNRGILHEDLHKAQSQPHSDAMRVALEIVRWVNDVASAIGDDGNGGISPVRVNTWKPMADGLRAVTVQVVLMDVCSLLERRPHVTIGPDGGAHLSHPYSICRLKERSELELADVPGGALLEEFRARLDPDLRQRPTWDPVRANIETLDRPGARTGLLTLLRAGELAASRRLSYREVWGAFVRAVVGDLPETRTPESAKRFLAKPIPDASQPVERFEAFARLADLRLHQAVVGARFRRASTTANPRSAEKNPVLRVTKTVDPILDATPDWTTPVAEAFEFPDDDHHSPLRTLAESKAASSMQELITEFDELLDKAYLGVQPRLSEPDRRSVDSWYGGYLTRLYALGESRPAFLDELDEWTHAWQFASWPPRLKHALRTLIFPARSSDAHMLLPVLEARAHPVIGDSEAPRLVRVLEYQDTAILKTRRGEALFVTIKAGEGAKAELELDFDLLREALACNDGEVGISDRARATLPRLERFRANLLRPNPDLSYAVLTQGRELAIEMDL